MTCRAQQNVISGVYGHHSSLRYVNTASSNWDVIVVNEKTSNEKDIDYQPLQSNLIIQQNTVTTNIKLSISIVHRYHLQILS